MHHPIDENTKKKERKERKEQRPQKGQWFYNLDLFRVLCKNINKDQSYKICVLEAQAYLHMLVRNDVTNPPVAHTLNYVLHFDLSAKFCTLFTNVIYWIFFFFFSILSFFIHFLLFFNNIYEQWVNKIFIYRTVAKFYIDNEWK